MVDAHAIALIAIPLAAIVLLGVLPRREPTMWGALIALCPVVVLLLLTNGTVHGCREGQDVAQGLIPGVVMLLVLLFMKPPRTRWVVALVLASTGVTLSLNFNSVVHGGDWTGNPTWPGTGPMALRSIRNRVLESTAHPEDLSAAYAAGWLRELPMWPELGERAYQSTRHMLSRRVITPVWHSWLTGLYRKHEVPQDVWFPGGPLREGLLKLELRDREVVPDLPFHRP